jgi:nucleotide-binding universal stress UspA family protein
MFRAQKATTNGISLAKSVGASVTAITEFAPFHAYDVLPSAAMNDILGAYVGDVNANEWLGDVAKMAHARGVRCRLMQVEQAQPHEGIIKTAAQ